MQSARVSGRRGIAEVLCVGSRVATRGTTDGHATFFFGNVTAISSEASVQVQFDDGDNVTVPRSSLKFGSALPAAPVINIKRCQRAYAIPYSAHDSAYINMRCPDVSGAI